MQTGVKDITYLTPKEVKRYENEIELCKRNLLNVDRSIFASERGIDKDEIRKKIKKNEKILEERKSPGTLEKDRDKLYRRAKELEEFIKDGMPTKDEHMGKRKTNSDGKKYQEAQEGDINKEMRWMTEKASAVREWKRIMRMLEPDNPSITNVESLRPNKRRIV